MSIAPCSNNPDVSVVIPHFNQIAALKECLYALRKQSFPVGKFEILVVDNGSSEDLEPLKKEFFEVRFFTEKARGAAHARNKALENSYGEIIAFTDADCIAEPDWIENAVKALENVDIVGGAVRVTTQGDEQTSSVEAFEQIFAFRQRMYVNRKKFAVTANLITRKSVIDLVGGFRHGVAEDLEWCRRAGALGFRLAFNGTPIINHPARRSWVDLTTKWDRLITERWNGLKGDGRVRKLKWASLAIATALSAAPHVALVIFSQRTSGVRNRLAAMNVLLRIRLWRARRMLALLRG